MATVSWGLAGALAAAAAYGAATVLQAVAVRSTARVDRLEPRLLLRLLRSVPYVVGLALDALGFLLSLAALRALPLFVVEAVLASSLAFTAVLGRVFLRLELRSWEWSGVAAVTVGLAALGLSAAPQHPAHLPAVGRVTLVVAAGLLVVLAWLVARAVPSGPAQGAAALGAVAGLGYAVVGVGARVLVHPTSLAGLAGDPATWAIVVAGPLSVLVYAQALQRGAVTAATAAVVVTETLLPAIVGIVLLGDRPRHGLVGAAVAGFVLTVGGALVLTRYGEAPAVSPEGPAPAPSPAPRPAPARDRSGR